MRLRYLALVLLTLGCAGRDRPEAAPRRETFRPPGVSPMAPYTPAIRSGNLVFLSGQIGVNDQTRGDIRAETRQALANIRSLLEGMGLGMQDLVKCTVFLADIRDYAPMNEVYREAFTVEPPARSAIGVGGLPAGARVEIECIAAAD